MPVPRLNIAGERYGRLVAIEYIGIDVHKHSLWSFRCDCGNKKIMAINHVRRGKTRSCGECRRHRTTTWPYKPDWADKFYAKIRINPFHPKGCHEWAAGKNQFGYGQFNVNGRHHKAHRVAWMLDYGPIPEGWQILHRCDNPSCVRPDHLFLGVPRINIADMDAKGRRRRPDMRGEKNPKAKLTGKKVQAIRIDQRALNKIATEYGVTATAIREIKSRKRWTHIP
jgi:hypothetical protein